MKRAYPKCSLLISTYNWPKALEFCLQSVLQQTILPNEILIADDGSTTETRNLIEKLSTTSKVPIQHIWHEDHGFQLAQIRNKAIAKTNFEYIIQIDGDIILDKNFISDHLNFCRPNYFVVGSRGLITEHASVNLLSKTQIPSVNYLRKNSENKLNVTRLPFLNSFFAKRYKVKGKYKTYAKGCNMAFWKKDLIEVNGYNENINGWGSEDEELVARLLKAGKQKQFLKFSGIVFHIWHKINSRNNEDTNKELLLKTLAKADFRCTLGIDQYL